MPLHEASAANNLPIREYPPLDKFAHVCIMCKVDALTTSIPETGCGGEGRNVAPSEAPWEPAALRGCRLLLFRLCCQGGLICQRGGLRCVT